MFPILNLLNPTNNAIILNDSFTLTILDNDKNVGINKLEAQTMKVYPNKFQTKISIKSEDVIDNIVIYDYSGQKVYDKKCKGNECTLELNQLENGMYILEVLVQNQIIRTKILKE